MFDSRVTLQGTVQLRGTWSKMHVKRELKKSTQMCATFQNALKKACAKEAH